MKKLFTLAITMMALFTSLNVSADDYRRTWDFRNGFSESTKEMLAGDPTHWTVQGTGYQNTAMTVGNAQVWYNGEAVNIPELEGLTLGGLGTAAHVQIVTTESMVKETNCLWINGKKSVDYISLTVPAGEPVKIGYCSHSNKEARGFSVSSGFADADGNTKFTSICDGSIVEVNLINSNTEESTLKLTSTNGHHIYYIIIGDGDVATSSKVGYLYYEAAGQGFEELPLYNAVKDMENTTFEPIKVDDGNPTAEQLKAYDAIVLDGSLPADENLVAALKDNIQWQPTLNVNAALAEALGYGKMVETASNAAIVNNIKKSWFSNIEGLEADPESGLYFLSATNETGIQGMNLTEGTHNGETSLADATDEEGAKMENAVFNYVRNSGHNEYVFYGAKQDYSDQSVAILQKILADVAGSKSDISATSKVAFTGSFKEMESTITLSCINKNSKIYYTTDGTQPTIESTEYTEPLVFTSECTIKAIAIAEGYTVSEVNSFDVKLYHQAKQPTITVNGGGANSDATIEIASEDGENAVIWYNFTASSDTLASSKYVGPITLKTSATITAFAIGAPDAALVQSELATADVTANTQKNRRTQLAHFNASGWGTLENLAINGETMTAWGNTSNYYFSWGKTARASYTESEEPEVDADGNPLVDADGNPIMGKTYLAPDTTTCSTDADWQMVSAGQVMIYQGNTLSTNIGNFTGYNPERAEDYLEKLATNSDVQFGGVYSGDKYTASIMSRNQYTGPFNVVAIVANVNGDKTTGEGKPGKVAVQVSKDGQTWQTVGDTLVTSTIFRNYKKFEVEYNAAETVYVRLASIANSSQAVHDIYVFNNPNEEKAATGDVNGDGTVDIADVNAIISVICGGETNSAADVNGDGAVDIADVNAVIGIICGSDSLGSVIII